MAMDFDLNLEPEEDMTLHPSSNTPSSSDGNEEDFPSDTTVDAAITGGLIMGLESSEDAFNDEFKEELEEIARLEEDLKKESMQQKAHEMSLLKKVQQLEEQLAAEKIRAEAAETELIQTKNALNESLRVKRKLEEEASEMTFKILNDEDVHLQKKVKIAMLEEAINFGPSIVSTAVKVLEEMSSEPNEREWSICEGSWLHFHGRVLQELKAKLLLAARSCADWEVEIDVIKAHIEMVSAFITSHATDFMAEFEKALSLMGAHLCGGK
eukprot:TRINITY_DN2168_c0_g2_i1.p1 TRINITY_DN2168_c0_g2~~TRINITY_DN2168_c0_g2_i1.p1  ORF type:complete len:268 (-),score=76.37 TRINITY_DN2168_c0_g2_i1:75-878(-)